MLTKLKFHLSQAQTLALGAFAMLSLVTMTLVAPASSHAAADATTGIDWKVDLVDPALGSAKGAVLAGLAIMALLMAVQIGRRAIKTVAK